MTDMTHTKIQMATKSLTWPSYIPSQNWKQSIKAKAEIKANVNLANKHKVKGKNFIISIFYFPVFFLRSVACCNASTILFSIPVFFFFEDFFKAFKEQIFIIGI